MSLKHTYIVNRDGTQMIIGSGDYADCYIENQALSDEYQGASTYRVRIHANVVLPVEIGARCFPQETNGAGGYVMLTPPDVEVVTAEHFIYDLIFMGFSSQLEAVLLFNQDAVGWGWETAFSLVGTGQDFIDLIVRNMNRTVPTDSNLELWQAGTVDVTGTTLITFDGDNCLTALKKVSEAFGIPYEVQGNGGFHEYWVSIKLTAVKRLHTHTYSLGSGLSRFKRLGDSDRKFATALCALGSTKNIPYDYRGGLKRLHCGNPSAVFFETVYDENTEWTYTLIEVNDPDTYVYPQQSTNPAHGTYCLEIYNTSNQNLGGTKIRFSGSSSIDLAGTSLKMWIGTNENWVPYPEGVFTIYLYRGESLQGSYTVSTMQNEIWKSLRESPYWKEISIPASAFHCSFADIDRLEIHIINWGQYGTNPYDQYLRFDNIRFEGGGEQQLENFVFGTTYTDAHGKIELQVINEDIFPRLNGSITELVLGSVTQFIDSSMPFDLNAKDGDGNTLYLIPDVTAKINFTSGNLSGYTLAVNWYKHSENKFDLVPYTEESGNIIPSDNPAYCLQVGDRYVITEILLPDEYITAAEQELYAWAVAQYDKYVQPNELAEVEIDHVWLYSTDASDLTTCTTADPTPNAAYLPDGHFKAGDLIHIYVEGLYDRELMIQSVEQERAQDMVTTYKITLGSNDPMNVTGKMLMSIREINTKMQKEEQKLGKYFHK